MSWAPGPTTKKTKTKQKNKKKQKKQKKTKKKQTKTNKYTQEEKYKIRGRAGGDEYKDLGVNRRNRRGRGGVGFSKST